jgi:heptosyltransferase II
MSILFDCSPGNSLNKIESHLSPHCKANNIIININSEASSRRLPKEKAISIIEDVRKNLPNEIILIGSPNEKEFVDEVFNSLADKTGIKNIAGTTSLMKLAEIFSASQLILTTDSGPAHLANALGVKTVVLFGAGDENETAPYNPENRTIIRLGQLSCEPCRDNICKRYGIPKCLTSLNEQLITGKILQHLHNGI